MHFPAIRFAVKPSSDRLFSGKSIRTFVFLFYIAGRIQGRRGFQTAACTGKPFPQPFSLRPAHGTGLSGSPGVYLCQFYGMQPAFINQPLPDKTSEIPCLLPVCTLGITFSPVFNHGFCYDDFCRLFDFQHPVQFGIDKCFRPAPSFFLLPVVFQSSKIIDFNPVRFLQVPAFPDTRLFRKW